MLMCLTKLMPRSCVIDGLYKDSLQIKGLQIAGNWSLYGWHLAVCNDVTIW